MYAHVCCKVLFDHPPSSISHSSSIIYASRRMHIRARAHAHTCAHACTRACVHQLLCAPYLLDHSMLTRVCVHTYTYAPPYTHARTRMHRLLFCPCRRVKRAMRNSCPPALAGPRRTDHHEGQRGGQDLHNARRGVLGMWCRIRDPICRFWHTCAFRHIHVQRL